MKNNYEQIEAWTDALYDEVKSIRRDFHKYPEPGWAEIRTSSLIARKLQIGRAHV